MDSSLSGSQFTLAFGDYSATIASVGASLRTLSHAGRHLVVPFDADEVRPAFRGATLAPWPNRVVDGTYSFAGVAHELPLTEPRRGHALHGLAAWLDFTATSLSDFSVTLSTTIEAQDGYPFRLQLEVTYLLDDNGLHSTVTATNTGPVAAPFGTGPHPYLVAGEGRVDDWILTLPTDRVLTVTDDRLIPSDLVDVAALDARFDFRAPRRIGDVFIDHAFTGLVRDELGTAEVRLTTSAGTGVAMRWDDACAWVQVHTADRPDPAVSRLGLAVEPMTCPPDAFNSGTDLITIEPGESTAAGWTIAAL